MDPSELKLLLLFGGMVSACLGILALFWFHFEVKPERRRIALSKLRLTEEQREKLIQDFQIYERLPDHLQEKLEGLIHIFNDKKKYVTEDGLEEVTPHMKRVIAAQACLIFLEREADFYPWLRKIRVSPGIFFHQAFSASGQVFTKEIKLSWSETRKRSDWEKNYLALQVCIAGGDFLIRHKTIKAHQDHIKKVESGSKSIYIAETSSLNHFFAYSTALFYENPARLIRENPELYHLFTTYYKVDPIIWRRTHLSNLRLTEKQRKELNKDFGLYKRLPTHLQEKLEGLIHVFNDEKEYIPENGLEEVTPHMQRVIAAQACLLIIGRKDEFYSDLHKIHVYPEDYQGANGLESGQISEYVISIAWSTVEDGGRDLEDGYNIVFIIFARYFDRQDGYSDGLPRLTSENKNKQWNSVLKSSYEEQKELVEKGRRITMDSLGVRDHSSFFAYSTAVFYEKPEQLRDENPELYQMLSDYYKLNPIEWLYQRREQLSKLRLTKWKRDQLMKDFKLFKYLPKELQDDLEGLIHVFNDEKKYVAEHGLKKITPQMKRVIAAQACLLILRREHDMFGKLHTIYVRPESYSYKLDGKEMRAAGESSRSGYIILSWQSSLYGSRHLDDGYNVVIHEMVHQLDQVDQVDDGIPYTECKNAYQFWTDIMGPAFEKFSNKVKNKDSSFLREYGASGPEEFFTVSTEAFYEQPTLLKKQKPEVYQLLSDYYGVNPVEWF